MDEVLVVMESGKVMRAAVAEVPTMGRDTMGVIFAKPDEGGRIVGVARNAEKVDDTGNEGVPSGAEATDAAETSNVLSDKRPTNE
jgi:DNA gyrase subunit A